jgi:putative membrane protein
MPFEHRLHPASFLFAITGHLRNLIVPALAVVFTAGATGAAWELWLILAAFPLAFFALVRSLSYRYRLEEAELVVRTGFVFRNERHIPYGRIQNVEAIQNVLHRLFDVVEVRIETGATNEDEATMRVVRVPAYHEIRDRVVAHRAGAVPGEADAVADKGDLLLSLPVGELLLSGLIANRSFVVIAAALGILWELGLFEPAFEWIFGEGVTNRRAVRQFFQTILGGGVPSLWYIGLGLLFVASITAISMIWALVRLYGFTLRRAGDDLLVEYGLLTRITTTIPIRRVQTLTVYDGPLYRLFGRANVKVQTAGGESGQENTAQKEPLVPIVRRADLDRVLQQVLPEVHIPGAEWQPPAARAFGRELRQSAAASALLAALLAGMLGTRALLIFAALLALSAIHARRYVRTLGWALVDNAVLFRRGWVWRRLTAARFSKLQTIVLHESPFDRRTGMARVQVDTAGTGGGADAVNIPYIALDAARQLHERLAAEASRTRFEW